MLLRLALRSLLNRWLTVAPTIAAVALSVALLVGVEKIRHGAEQSFRATVSDVDLIVGARTGGVQLLLYSVFRIGSATNNITWESYEDIAKHRLVAWTVPLSLGDSHRGFRVLGSTEAYFDRYKYRGGRSLAFSAGRRYNDIYEAVLGADVAERLGYALGQKIVIAHGVASFVEHDDKPFTVVGILKKTGTPVDRTVHVSLESIEAIHVDWRGGGRDPNNIVTAEEARRMDLSPKAITAVMVGAKSPLGVFRMQRDFNTYREEPLMAILPGVALSELWSLISVAETALLGVSVMVMAASLLGLMAIIFASLNERRREMAILRAVGARPHVVIGLLTAEAAVITLVGAVVGTAMLYLGLAALQPYLDAEYGVFIPVTAPNAREWALILAVVPAGVLVSLIPAWRAYANSLADGMTVRR